MQTDLFETIPGTPLEPTRQTLSFLDRYRLTIRLDQILFGFILLIVLNVFVYSIGVEAGYRAFDKKVKRAEQAEKLAQMKKAEEAAVASDELESSKASSAETVAKTSSEESEKRKAQIELENKKYTIQMVTYMKQAAADQLLEKLQAKGLEGFVIPSGNYLQVCVSAFEKRSEAKKLLTQLKSDGIAPPDAYIRMIPH